MAHSHGDTGTGPTLADRAVRRALFVALAVLGASTLTGLVLLWPDGEPAVATDAGFGVELVDATVARIELRPCSGVGDAGSQTCELISVRLTSGPDRGATASFEIFPSASNPKLDRGDDIVLTRVPGVPPENAYQFADFQRDGPLLWLVALFVVAVVALGRWKGVRALLGVGVSLLVIVEFLLPALLEGRSPVLLALVAASTIAFLALFLTHGVSERTAVALLGTLASLAIAAALAVAFVSATRLTGLVEEEAMLLRASSGVIDLQGLLLAGILVGALGVLDDVTVTQVSAVWELKRADPQFGTRELYVRAVRIGRDHIASVVNTLVLAYAGAALPLLLLFSQSSRTFGEVVTGEAVAVEIVRTLVGSIGLVAAVPVTTALAAAVVGRSRAATAIVERPSRVRRRRDPFWDDADLDDRPW